MVESCATKNTEGERKVRQDREAKERRSAEGFREIFVLERRSHGRRGEKKKERKGRRVSTSS